MVSKYRPKTERKYIRFKPCYIMKHEIDDGTVIKRHKSCSPDKYIIYKDFDNALSVGIKTKNFYGRTISRTMIYKTFINPASEELTDTMEIVKEIEINGV